MYGTNLLEGLNPEQLRAVTLPHQSALILAGAGSGKTRVLTTRIAWLIQTGQVLPHGLLSVTFTNKAAREMLTRISGMLPIDTRGMWVGTFHGLCNRLLRAHHRDAGFPQTFQILDSADQLSLIKRLLKALNIDDDKYTPRDLQYFINANKEAGNRASRVETSDEFSGRMVELYAAYDEQCNREGVVDFAELLLRSFELLSRNEVLRNHYQRRFGHILVDEFQDTNRLQYRWLKLLAGEHNAIFSVGDDDQSIYAFRGASARNVADFERDFARGQVIKLEQNYRSHGNILDAANALIRNNHTRLGKNLWTSEGKGEALRFYEAASDVEEAKFIVDEVRGLAREGVALASMAILYRSNAQSRALEHSLFSAGLAYRVYGGLRFFERQEIKHALAYLRLVANPDDDNSLLRVINMPTRGIGARSIEQLQDLAKHAGTSLWQAACSNTLGGKAGTGAGAFVRLIGDLQKDCEPLTLPEAVEHVTAASGLTTHYLNEREGADRIENLKELVTAATVFAADPVTSLVIDEEGNLVADPDAEQSWLITLNNFLAHASLESGEHQAGEGQDALQLMTVHSAKGLEFHTVFVTGLEEGLFPHENSLNDADGTEEERRLMYVALTRARRRLYLTLAQTRMLHGQTRYNIESRFIGEIPSELVRRLTPPKVFARSEFSFTPSSHAPAVQRDPSSPWRIGQGVSHPKFGYGVIVNAEGRGSEARVQVNFRDAGAKWLALEYAKLSPA
ncbi:MAG: DNA helicase II [Betaproteobacteria bacterium]|nr:DNA helicase II [Betaproteobacteria bacterium]